MKKIFIMLLLLMTYCLPTYANEQEIVASFQTFARNLVAPIEATYGKGYYRIVKSDRGYFKSKQTDFSYSCDIKKTDSVMYPYLGILEISNKDNFSKLFATEAEARNVMIYTMETYNTHRFTYRYCNGKWEENRAYMYLDGHWNDSSFKSINSYKCTQN